MSHRAGHVYDLSEIGYDKQKAKAIEIFSQWTDSQIYAIDGNHDRWFIKSNGALIVRRRLRRKSRILLLIRLEFCVGLIATWYSTLISDG